MADQTYTGVDNLEVLTAARRYNAFLLREVLAAAGGAKQALDFGAGIGTFARAARDGGLTVACLETDPSLRASLAADGFTAWGDLAEIPEGTLPYAYSLNVLEHIEDDGKALSTLASRLAPSGVLFLYVPAFQILFSAMDRKVGHHRRYRREGLVDLVAKAGLIVDRAEYVDCLGFAASLAYKAVGNRQGDLNQGSIALYDTAVFPVSRVLDRVFRRWLGKNLLIVAHRP